jgi:type VI protein secretion system component Hcp
MSYRREALLCIRRILGFLRPVLPSLSLLAGASVLLVSVFSSNAAHAQVYFACFGEGGTKSNPIASCPTGGHQSQILALSIGGENPAEVVSGVLKQGVPTLSSMSVLKTRDTTSDTLLKDAYNVTIVPSIVICDYPAGATNTSTPLYTFVLTNAVLTSWQWGWGAGSPSITESLSLTYEKLAIVNDTTGQTVTWNLQDGKPQIVHSLNSTNLR